jgi:hypothetical protein
MTVQDAARRLGNQEALERRGWPRKETRLLPAS